MAAFTRYARVLDLQGNALTVRETLALIKSLLRRASAAEEDPEVARFLSLTAEQGSLQLGGKATEIWSVYAKQLHDKAMVKIASIR